MQKVTLNNLTVTLEHDAFIDNDNLGNAAYFAYARDTQGTQYLVKWDIICENDQGDESNACDWESPGSITLL